MMKIARSAGLTLVWVLSMFAAPVFAQEPAQAPTSNLGDTWVYERTNRFNNTVIDHSSEEIIEVGLDALKMRVRTVKGLEFENVYTKEMNFVSGKNVASGAVTSTSPPFATLKFPLVAGAEWSSRFTRTTPSYSFGGTLKGKVVGFEKITTPAGTFDAWILEYSSMSDRGALAQQRYWYAPAVKRVVVREYEDKLPNGQRNDWYREVLIAYRLGEQKVG